MGKFYWLLPETRYQYYSHKNEWSHARTKDFVRWERLPVAMAPDMGYDKNGCFSGGAQTATMTIYTPQECDGITFQAEGNVLVDVEKYDLKF